MNFKRVIFISAICFLAVFWNSDLVWAASPILKLQTSVSSIEVGQNLTIELFLDTLGQTTVGVDAVLSFDNAFLEVKEVECGSIYPNCPANFYDNGQGTIKVAGSANYNQYFSGQGVFAKIKLEAKKAGLAVISFIWQNGATNETNVVSPNKRDLLTSGPIGWQVEIKTPSSSQDNFPTPTPTLNPAPTTTPVGLIDEVATPEKPTLIKKISQVTEKIKEKILPSNEKKLISPLGETASPVLGAQKAEKASSKWLWPTIALLAVSGALNVIFTKKIFFTSKFS